MEIRHLRTLDAVVRHGSFTLAAEELHVAQSAVSQQIRRLEAELGVIVLRRSSRGVELTPEGRMILGYARRVLVEVDALKMDLAELTGQLQGRIDIGTIFPTGTYDLPGVLAEFRSLHPGVTVHMVEHVADAMLDMLREDELDCAFASLDPSSLGDEFAATLLWEEDLLLAAPVGHPLASTDGPVPLSALAGEDLISYRENSAMQRRIDRALARAGAEPVKAFVCTEMGAVRALASKGLGVAVLPRSVAEQEGPPIAVSEIEIDGAGSLTWPVALIWRTTRRLPPAVKAFLAIALEAAEPQGADAEYALPA